MDRLNISTHISKQFNAELEELRRVMLEMGGLVEEQLALGLKAWENLDHDLAQVARERDQRVDRFELKIDEQAASILARRQPAASDLRLLLSVIKVVVEVERIGDESVRIAKMADLTRRALTDANQIDVLLAMGAIAQGMLRDVFNAFARTDLDQAIDVIRRDKQIDARFNELKELTIRKMEGSPDRVRDGINVLWAARSLERIGDRCKNIAEYVAYLVQGRDVRHSKFGRESK
jgi:phosphate transport system protein